MTAALARALVALAVSCLGGARREWGLAMQVELEAAREAGRPLSFAAGCLLTAWRELPAHEEGRFIMASNVLALVLIVPAAALLTSSLVADFPLSILGWTGSARPLLNDANRSAVPALAALVALLAAWHVRIAWLMLERDWARVASAGMLVAAATVTLTLFTGLVFVDYFAALTQAAAVAVELSGISALAWWHARSFGGCAESLAQQSQTF